MLCLKNLGNIKSENSLTDFTTNWLPSKFHEMIRSFDGSLTISKVLVKKEGTVTWLFDFITKDDFAVPIGLNTFISGYYIIY